MTAGISVRAASPRHVRAAFLAGMTAVIVSSTSSWAQSDSELAVSPAATTASTPPVNCKQGDAANKAAGETEANGQPPKACPAADPPSPAGTQASPSGDLNKLRESAQNPVASLISVQFQNNLNYGYGHYNAPQNVLNFQPIIPFQLNDDWNLITRWVSPIVDQPRLAPHVGSEFGMGTLEPQFYFSPAHPGDIIWGAGPALYLPTATDKTLGVNAWGGGPTAVALMIPRPWLLGVLVNNVWAWRDGQKVNQMTIQYFINYNMSNGWYLVSQPIITSNWRASGDDKWVVPFGGGIGRVFKADGLPAMNAQAEAFYNVVRPTSGPLPGPKWSLRFQLSLLFPAK